MDDQERAARLAALILALRSGGAQTIPNANPAALVGALRGGPHVQQLPPQGLERINGARAPNPYPASPMPPMPINGVRG